MIEVGQHRERCQGTAGMANSLIPTQARSGKPNTGPVLPSNTNISERKEFALSPTLSRCSRNGTFPGNIESEASVLQSLLNNLLAHVSLTYRIILIKSGMSSDMQHLFLSIWAVFKLKLNGQIQKFGLTTINTARIDVIERRSQPKKGVVR